MTLRQRAFAGAEDLRAMADLVTAFPARQLHVVDLPYRLCSWALDEPDSIGVWANAAGEVRGRAVMHTAFWHTDNQRGAALALY